MNETLLMMLVVSLFIGGCGLFAFFWGMKNEQFDDGKKFLSGALMDSEKELKSAAELQKKTKGKK